ncbi:MAG: O-antigen ligase family protein [Bacteroidota bacterium]
MKITKETIEDRIFFFGLALLVAFLPESKFIMSLSQFILAFGWVIGGNIPSKIRSFFQNKVALALTLIFLIHLIGLSYTEDYSYAMKDLRIKLPLLIFPLIISTSRPLTIKQFETLLYLFCGSVLVATLYSFAVWMGWTHHQIHDIREISVYISHIRFGIMIAFSVLLLGRFIYLHHKTYSQAITIVIAAVLVWFLMFLVILEAITGLVMLGITILTLIIYLIWNKRNIFLRITLLAVFIGIPMLTILYVYQIYKPIKDINPTETYNLPTLTKQGNAYENDTLKKERENGHLMWIQLNWPELREAWNRRSTCNFDSLGTNKQSVKYALVRYLTSKGMKKDGEAVNALNAEDIHAVERGVTNIHFMNPSSLKARIYETLWELDNYQNGGSPNGHSMVQRLEYWKTSLAIIHQNPWFGVGTGDINTAFKKEYDLQRSPLDEKHRLKAHNQYLSITVTFGLIGLAAFLFALGYPLIKNRNYLNYHYAVFWIFVIISMLTEDTLETQPGVTFFILFNTLFLFQQGYEKRQLQ